MNVAIILEKFYPFKQEDVNYLDISQVLSQDPVFKTLQESANFKPPRDFIRFLYSDYLEAIKDFNTEKERMDVLNNLLNVSLNFSEEVTKHTVTLLYFKLAEGKDVFSLFRLAEAYRKGDLFPQNSTRAFNYYKKVVATLSVDKEDDIHIYSQAYYHLGYMRHYGIGCEKNLTKAISNYNISIILNEKSGILAWFLMKLAQLEAENSKLLPLINLGVFFTENANITLKSYLMESFNQKLIEDLPVYFLMICLAGLVVLRIRLHNYIEIFLSHKK